MNRFVTFARNTSKSQADPLVTLVAIHAVLCNAYAFDLLMDLSEPFKYKPRWKTRSSNSLI